MKSYIIGLVTLVVLASLGAVGHSLSTGPLVLEPDDPAMTTIVIPTREPAADGAGDVPDEARPADPPEESAAAEGTLVLDTLEIELPVVGRLFESGTADFVDARPAGEYEAGHILGAMNITPAMLNGRTPAPIRDGFLTEDRPIVVYCGGGDCDDSHVVVQRLQQLGFTRAHVYLGGYPEWVAAGLPTDTGPDPFAD